MIKFIKRFLDAMKNYQKLNEEIKKLHSSFKFLSDSNLRHADFMNKEYYKIRENLETHETDIKQINFRVASVSSDMVKNSAAIKSCIQVLQIRDKLKETAPKKRGRPAKK